MTCIPHVVPVRGVEPDARGISSVRVVGFRGHCDCGWLGHKRDNHFNARSDCEQHKRGHTIKIRKRAELSTL